MIFGFGLLLMIDLPALVGVLGLFPFLIWYLGKQALVVPRVGSIQQSQTMRNRFKGFFVNLLIIGICVFVLFLLSNRSGFDSLSNYSLVIFGLVIALAISSLGLLMKTFRYYIYATIIFLAMSIGSLFNLTFQTGDLFLILVMIAGGIILLCGMTILIRFLKKYPPILIDQ